jgi:TolB-like protein
MGIAVFLFCGLAVSAFPQNAVPLEKGLKESVAYFEGRLPRGTKLAVLNMTSPSPDLADYVIEEMTGCLVNSNSFTLVERSNLALLQQEMDFQFSGEVSDETVRSIGRKLGAQTVVTGSITLTGNVFRLRIRAVDIETGVIQGQFNANIVKDQYLAGLYNQGVNQASPSSAPPPSAPASQEAPAQKPAQQNPPPNSGGRVRLPEYLFK